MNSLRRVFLWIAAVFFIGAGINHFVAPAFYRQIVPPMFPAPAALVAISGACEIAGGVGLLAAALRRPAGWGLIALLIAVFPANIYMAIHEDHAPWGLPNWTLWTRLPLQGILIAWVWFVALTPAREVKIMPIEQ
jgi:uncharacterized membrane protein